MLSLNLCFITVCPGNELAKLEMLIFIHHLVTKYRVEVIGSNNEVEHSPFPVPKQGLPAILRKSHSEPGNGLWKRKADAVLRQCKMGSSSEKGGQEAETNVGLNQC